MGAPLNYWFGSARNKATDLHMYMNVQMHIHTLISGFRRRSDDGNLMFVCSCLKLDLQCMIYCVLLVTFCHYSFIACNLGIWEPGLTRGEGPPSERSFFHPKTLFSSG